MGVDPTADNLGAVSSMLANYDSPNESIVFKWAFPNYNSFDTTYSNTFTLADGTPGGRLRTLRRLEVDGVVCREDRRLHVV